MVSLSDPPRTRKGVYSGFVCDRCGRRLKVEHYVRSAYTRKRYCWPGEGCAK